MRDGMARRGRIRGLNHTPRLSQPRSCFQPALRLQAGFFVLALTLPAAPLLADPFANLATPEFQVNTHTPNDQRIPSIASDAQGNSVVTWQSRNQEAPGWGIYAQRFDALPEPVGEEFRVNMYNQGTQDSAHASMHSDGSFVVVWNGKVRPTTNLEIIKRRFDAAGDAMFDDRQVGETVDNLQIVARSALDDQGRLVVAWEARGVTNATFNILARHFNASGQPLTPVTQINQFDTTAQRRAEVALNSAGDQVIAWQSSGQDGSDWGIFARCMSFAGPGGDEFLVNQTTQGGQARPRVALAEDGSFAIVWQDNMGQSSISYQRVMLRLYDDNCQAITGEIQVNQVDDGIQDLPDIALDGDGHYVVVWQSFTPDFENQGIYGRRVDGAGRMLGDEFKISQEVEAFQDFPAVTGMPDGGFMVAWETVGQDGSGFGIYARRFFGPAPAVLNLLGGGDQTTTAGSDFPEPLHIRLQNQFGEPIIDRTLRLESSEFGPGAVFAGGETTLQRPTDDNGEIRVEMRANDRPGAHSVTVSLEEAELSLDIPLVNLALIDPPVPVPLGGAWAGLLFFLLWVLACVNLVKVPRRD